MSVIPFYGYRVKDGERLYRLSVKPGTDEEAALLAAGWQFRHQVGRDYNLWSRPANLPEPERTKTQFGASGILVGPPQ